MFNVLEMFLEALVDAVGSLSYVLDSTFLAHNGINEIFEFTGVFLGNDVSEFR